MISFLTSQLNPEGTGALNPANGFVDELRRCLPSPIRALDICYTKHISSEGIHEKAQQSYHHAHQLL